jgi:hypothetical protein
MIPADALDLVVFGLAAFTLPVLLMPAFLPQQKRKKLLQRLSTKWIF